jgi:hypothetical protein
MLRNFRPHSLLICSLFASAPLAAQLPPLTLPKGLFRLDLGGRFDNWDKSYFDGVKRDASGAFVRDAIDENWLPALDEAAQRLRNATGAQAISLSLGTTRSNMLVNVGSESIGAAYGLTRRLTVFATVPIVRVRVQEVFRVDSTAATAGFNPADPLFGTTGGSGVTGLFFGELNGTLATLSSNLQNLQYEGDPGKQALAQATLARGLALQTDLQDLFTNSPFLPLAGTPAAAALAASIDSLRNRLVALDVFGLDNSPALPTTGIPAGGLEDFATRSGAGIEAQPFEPPILRSIGDVEVGAAYAWLDRRPVRGGLAIRSVLQGTVRLATGKLDRPDAFFDLGTGEHQTDVQGDLVTDFGAGWIGARVTARYVLQLPGRLERRLTRPDQPIAPATTLATVERDPGEIVEGALEPYLRLAPHLAFVTGVRHWSKGVDRFKYVQSQAPIPGTTPDVLAMGSKENGTVLTAALSFVHDGARSDGRRGVPIDAILRGELVVGSSQGRVPARQSISFMLRLYRKMF